MDITSITQLVVEVIKQYPWFGVVAAVISAASAIAAITPTPEAGSFLAKAYKIIDILALNVGKAKDK
jgi:hypothetical protein